jgi:thioredoxin-like negative regulator of GroEL
MARNLALLILTALILSACGRSSDEPPARATLFYDPAEAARPDAPPPIDADFRADTAAALVFHTDEAIRGAPPRPMLVMFYTDYCGDCIAMRPHIHALEAEYWGKIDFIYLDRELLLNYEIITLLDVQSQPEFVLMEIGQAEPVQHWRGAPPIETLRSALDDFLAERSGFRTE